MRNFIFFLLIAFQILHVFFTDILVHCALIKYAYICREFMHDIC
jgi:hypothetical protein